MDKVKKTMKFLGRLKWLGLVLGGVMCFLIQPLLGNIWSVVLGTAAGAGFMFICENERKNVLCDHVAEDLHNALDKEGYGDAAFEIKVMKPGMIIRVYAIGAGDNAAECNSIVVKKIAGSWYKENVWITQLVAVESEDEIESTAKALDEELLSDLKKMKEEQKKGRKN